MYAAGSKCFRQRFRVFSILLLVLSFLKAVPQSAPAGFKSTQTKYKRVRTAYDRKWSGLQTLLKEKGVDPSNFEVLIRCFKYEKQLEVWCKSKGAGSYALVKTIPICASSGELGPKRRQGDGQVPEGFYEVNWFNPMSDYHLGLKINYPNISDRKKATARDPGGDIMIHGNCVTIGCIPLEDEPIEELYVLCVETKSQSHDIPVNIFPFRMDEKNWADIRKKVTDTELIRFWASLKTAYDHFETSKSMPLIKVDDSGNYEVKVK